MLTLALPALMEMSPKSKSKSESFRKPPLQQNRRLLPRVLPVIRRTSQRLHRHQPVNPLLLLQSRLLRRQVPAVSRPFIQRGNHRKCRVPCPHRRPIHHPCRVNFPVTLRRIFPVRRPRKLLPNHCSPAVALPDSRPCLRPHHPV